MREIKFRVWDEEKKKMLYEGTNILGVDGFDYMQYTGLNDKNGKEIYEGDVVKINDDNQWWDYVYTVAYVDFFFGSFIFRNVRDVYDFVDFGLFSHVGDGTDKRWNPKKHKKFRVVGNIYENPELITNIDREIEI